ncbi:MAG: PIN domain-containing protein [Thermomicrobiales bacterium]
MSGLPFLDANVFVRHIAGDGGSHAPRATAYLARVEEGQAVASTLETVVFEAVFTLQTFYRMPREAIHEALVPLMRMAGLRVPHRRAIIETFDLFLEHRRLSFADCFHAVMARQMNASEFVSFDQDFDCLPWINRTEPT